jgi:hypothetical protein
MLRLWLKILWAKFMWLFKDKQNTNFKFLSTYQTAYGDRVKDWQQRQQHQRQYTEHNDLPFKDSKSKLQTVLLDMHKNVYYRKEPKGNDKWQVYQETELKGTGDCEDQAIYIMMKLREAGYSDSQIFVSLIEGHAFACVYTDTSKEDFYILDNGFLTVAIVKASELFPKNGKMPITAFNLFHCWRILAWTGRN